MRTISVAKKPGEKISIKALSYWGYPPYTLTLKRNDVPISTIRDIPEYAKQIFEYTLTEEDIPKVRFGIDCVDMLNCTCSQEFELEVTKPFPWGIAILSGILLGTLAIGAYLFSKEK